MRDIYRLAINGLAELTSRGRRALLIFLISLVAIASLDGIALLMLSKLLVTSEGNDQDGITRYSILLIIGIVILFILRSLLSTISTWASLKEFAAQEVEIGQKRFSYLQNSKLEQRQNLSQSDFYTAVDRGPTSLVQGFLVSLVTACAEALSGLVILAVVLVLQPVTAIVAFVYFATIAIIQHKFLSGAQDRAGQIVFKNGNGTYELLSDYFNMHKLLHVSKSTSFEPSLRDQRSALALARSKQTFFASLPRYFMEAMLALGFLVIAGVTWLFSGEAAVVPALAIFAAAGFRLLPIVNRIQGLLLMAIGYAPLAREALTPPNIEQSESGARSFRDNISSLSSSNKVADLGPLLSLRNVSFRYPETQSDVLKDINLEIYSGLQYAIVGPSGSGKTTLIDIILGLLTPIQGRVFWDCEESELKLGYVPQDTHVASVSISGNVALEWNSKLVNSEKVAKALSASQLTEHFHSSEVEAIGESVRKLESLSGGQRQRLGLARAIYRESNFLLLDEATSALDAVTESQVMETVEKLRGKTTVVIVAHRLSTIRDADVVIYLDEGKILGTGTFIELQKKVPQFEKQVRLGQLELKED
jgi:ABC-type multidrug transport system fused ATPase/permease subunit